MDTSFVFQAFFAVVPVYIIILTGAFVRRLRWIRADADSSFMRIAMDVALPCFFISNMLGNEKLQSVAFSAGTIAMGVAVMSAGMCVAWLASKILKLKVGEGQRTFVVTTAAHNYGFFIISIVALLYPAREDLLGLIITQNVGCDLVYWSLGFLLISQGGGFSWKMFLRAPIISVAVALLLAWTGLGAYVPQFLLNAMRMMGSCAITLNLFMFGCLLCDFWGFKNFNPRIVSSAVAVRMLVLPAIFLAAAALLDIDPSLRMILVFQAVVPCGVISAVLAKHFGGHPQMSVQITVCTSIVALITLPIYLTLGLKLIGAV